MTPKERAAKIMEMIERLSKAAAIELAWMLHDRSDPPARDRRGSPADRLFGLTGGMFRVVHEREREQVFDAWQDDNRYQRGIVEELLPHAAEMAQVRQQRGKPKKDHKSQYDEIRSMEKPNGDVPWGQVFERFDISSNLKKQNLKKAYKRWRKQQ
jgi:hypothetical protein